MKKYSFLTVFLLAILISCTTQTEEISPFEENICSFPYLEWKQGECCLDTNNNQICDMHEDLLVEESTIVPEETQDIFSELLAEIPDIYWFYNYNTGRVLVVGDKRRSFLDVERGITDIYWDIANKRAWKSCDIEKEIVQEGEKFEIDHAICDPNTLNIQDLTQEEYNEMFPFGPIDWMLKYKDKTPFKVETTLQTVGAKSISPVLHFRNEDGSITILRFDSYQQVPIIVEKRKDTFKEVTRYDFNSDFKIIDVEGNIVKEVELPEEDIPEKEPLEIRVETIMPLLDNRVYVKGKINSKGRKALPPQELKVDCYDRFGKLIGSGITESFEGVTEYKNTDFKVYVDTDNNDYFKNCTVTIL